MKRNIAAAICTTLVTVISIFLPAVIGDLVYHGLSGPNTTDITLVGDWVIGLLSMMIGTLVLTTGIFIITNVFNFFKREVF